jgi:hypothetical protein
MTNRFRSLLVTIPPYSANEPLFESERLDLHAIPIAQPVLSGGNGKDKNEDKDEDLGFLEPGKDEFKEVSKGLKFLKLSKDEAETLYDLIGVGIKLTSAIMTVIGAVNTVTDLIKKIQMFGQTEVSLESRLEAISARLVQIYGYLASSDRRGLYTEARGWRTATTLSRQSRWSVQLSRSASFLQTVIDRMQALDASITQMVEPESGKISFQRAVYGYGPGGGHWIDAARAPYVGLASGQPMPNYSDPNQELQAEIWDVGHYIDELISALRERALASAAVEPAFRSTGVYRAFFSDTAKALDKLIARWRGAFLIANPAACIAQDGELRAPINPAGTSGILIGATDPVTGISSMELWDQFAIKYITYTFGEAYGGGPQRSVAIDPVAALSGALQQHAQAVDQVIKASGIERLRKLQGQYQLLAEPVRQSEFVRLPVPTFQYEDQGLFVDPSGEPTTVDLGDLKKFASDPSKVYPAMRYYREMEKTFRFRMARRTEISRIQLGYRLRLESTDVELCPYSRRPAEGFPVLPFPNASIDKPFELTLAVADCCQTSHFSPAMEDSFEEEGGSKDRVFVPRGTGRAKIKVSVQFEPLADGKDDAHAGVAVVTIRNLDPREYRDAFALKVSVYETVTGSGDTPEPYEFEADYMTVHMTPSYLIVGRDFLEDYWRAFETMVKTIKGINDKLTLEQIPFERPGPIEDPKWNFRNPGLEVQEGINFIDAVASLNRSDIAKELIYFRSPTIRG